MSQPVNEPSSSINKTGNASVFGKRQRLSLKAWKCRPVANCAPHFSEDVQLNKSIGLDDEQNSQSHISVEEETTASENQSAILSLTCTLINTGNTCYLNSVIYALRYMQEFRKRLHEFCTHIRTLLSSTACDFQMNPYHSCILQLHELFHSMHELETKAVETQDCSIEINVKQIKPRPRLSQNPKKLLESLRKLNSSYEGNYQHDAHEFLGFLLSCLEIGFENYQQWLKELHLRRETRRNLKAKSLSTKQINCPGSAFTGKNLVNTLCLECENYSEMQESFRDVCITFLPDLQSADDATGTFTGAFHVTETLRDEDKFWCNFCCHPCEARRSSQFLHLPPVLVILLKPTVLASTVSGTFGMQKSSSHPLMLPETLPCLLESCQKPCSVKAHHFHLSAIVCHTGPSLSCGHYTVYVREFSTHSTSASATDQASFPENEYRSTLHNKTTCQEILGHKHSSCSAAADCCDPKQPTVCGNKWLHFDDERIALIETLPQFNYKCSTETPYLLFYQNKSETNFTF